MSHSFSQPGSVACPRCGAESLVECWLVVDVVERPDLAGRIADGTLHEVRCGRCGDRGMINAPLLLYRPEDSPCLVFSPVEGGGDDLARSDADALLAQLRGSLGAQWRDDWVAQGLMVIPRASVSLLLRAGGGLPVRIVAADQAAEACWQRYLAERAPDALDHAIDLWRDAVALAAGSPEECARCQYHLGRCLAERFGASGNLADLDTAIEALQQACGAAAAGLLRPKVLLVLGNVLLDRYERNPRRREDLNAAIDAYARAASLFGDGPDASVSLNNYAAALRLRFQRDRQPKDLDAAIDALETAIATAHDHPPQRVLAIQTLGSVLLARYEVTRSPTDLDASIEAFVRAVASVPTEDPGRLAYLHNQARALSTRYDLRRDDADAQAATRCFRESCVGAHASPGQALEFSAGWALWASRQHLWKDAVEAANQGLRALELLDDANVLLQDRRSWQRQGRGIVMMAAYALCRLGELQRAVVVLESYWARQLNERLLRQGAELQALRARDPDLHRRYRHAASEIRVLEAEEALASLRPNDAAAPSSPAQLRDRFRAKTGELDHLTALIRRLPGFERFGSVDFSTIAETVRAGEPLVYLVVTAVGSLALMIHRCDPVAGHGVCAEAVWADAFSVEDLNRLLVHHDGARASGYLPAAFGADDPDGRMLDAALAEVLPEVGERLVAPFAARLQELGADHVTLVPGGMLSLLPLSAASYSVDGRSRCLLDQCTVSQVPSARSLAHARLRLDERDRAEPSLLAISNPLPLPDGMHPLQWASQETAAIAGRFPAGRARVLEGPDATYESVAGGLAQATHLHFACHGLFSAVNPQLSLLVLSGGQPLLLYHVLYNLGMEAARLAVLSACETAQIDYRNLPEEAVGLPAGFLQAGVPGVIGALWAVDDESTSLLMEKFYEYHLAGDRVRREAPMSPARALGRAQRWLRDDTRFSAPYFWAPFALFGV